MPVMSEMDSSTNSTTFKYGQWGVPGLSAFVGSILCMWIILANTAVIVAICASKYLRLVRESICILHITIGDMCMGLIFGPLTVDYFVRGYWDHGCDFLFYYAVIPLLVTFVTIHAMGLLNLSKLISDCCRTQINRCLKVIILLVLFVAFWVYFMAIVVSTSNMRNERISFMLREGSLCEENADTTGISGQILTLLVYWPAFVLNIIMLIVMFIRVRKNLYTVEQQLITFKTYACATAVCCLVPLPAIGIFVNIGDGVCFTYNCQVLSSIANFYLMIKSGLMPVTWFISPEFRDSIKGVMSVIRPGNTNSLE